MPFDVARSISSVARGRRGASWRLPARALPLALVAILAVGQALVLVGIGGQVARAGGVRCDDPEAEPGASQAFLYSDSAYYGNCEVFEVGKDKSLANNIVGDNTVSSVKVGDSVVLILYTKKRFRGQEGFLTGDNPWVAWNGQSIVFPNDAASSLKLKPVTS